MRISRAIWRRTRRLSDSDKGLRFWQNKEKMRNMRLIALTVVAFGALVIPTVAPAQERILTVFGKDKCPSNTICVTAPESERYRIPKQLRDATVKPQNESWAARSQGTLSVANASPSACASATAASGGGCWASEMRRAREQRKQDAKDEGLTDNSGLRRAVFGLGDDE
jgi:hypothetical protein